MRLFLPFTILALLPITQLVAQEVTPTEIDLSSYLEAMDLQGESSELTPETLEPVALPKVQASAEPAAAELKTQALEPATVENRRAPFFDLPQSENVNVTLAKQAELLSSVNALVTLLRQIKEAGNDELVLTLYGKLANDPEALEALQSSFSSIELPEIEKPATSIFSQRPVQPDEFAAPSVASFAVSKKPIELVFAQATNQAGGRDKAILVVDGKRFTIVPGETIRTNGRTILVDSIEQVESDERPNYSVYVIENGRREALEWGRN